MPKLSVLLTGLCLIIEGKGKKKNQNKGKQRDGREIETTAKDLVRSS